MSMPRDERGRFTDDDDYEDRRYRRRGSSRSRFTRMYSALDAGKSAQDATVAEQACRGAAPQQLGCLAIGISALAPGKPVALAEEALAARNGEGHDDAIADLLACPWSGLDDLDHRLVADDIAVLHARNQAADDVQGRSRKSRRPLNLTIASLGC